MRHLIAKALLCALLGACTPTTEIRVDHSDPYEQLEADTSGGEKPQRFGGIGFPASQSNATFWVDGTAAEDDESPVLSTASYSFVEFTCTILSTDDPVGTLSVQRSFDGSTNWHAIYLDANKVYGSGFETFAGGTLISIDDPAATVVVSIPIANSAPYLRLAYDSTSGGVVAAIDCSVFQRAG